MKKKLIAALTSAAMVATMVPATAFAASTTTADNTPNVEVKQTQQTETAASVIEKIGEINSTISYDDTSKKAIEAARDAYNSLSDFDKESVKDETTNNLTRLENAEAAYKVYTDKLAEAQKAIDAIGATVTAADYATDGAVTKASALLTAGKVHVDAGTVGTTDSIAYNAADISLDETRTQKMNDLTEDDALKDLIDQIDGLDVIEETNYDTAKSNVTGARSAYEDLRTTQQDMVGNLGKLVSRENKIKKYEDAVSLTGYLDDAEKTIGDGQGEISLEQSETSYQKALEAYNNLSDTLKGKATTAKATLDNWKNNIDTYKAKQATDEAVAEVIRLISALPKTVDISLSNEAQVNEAEAAYEALGADKSKVGTEYSNVLAAATSKIDNLIADLTADERAQRVIDLINKLPAETAQITRDNTDVVKAAQAEYNRDVDAEQIAWDERASITGTQAEWQKKVDSTSLNRLKAAIQVIWAAENTDAQNLTKLKSMDGYTSEISVGDADQLENAKKAVEEAEEALGNANKYVKAAFESDADYNTLIGNLNNTKQNIADYEGKNSTENRSAADAIIAAMKALPGADSITNETLAAAKEQVEAVTTSLNSANTYVQQMVQTDSAAMKFYNEAVAKIKNLEDTAMVPEIESAIAALTILDATKTPTEAEIDQAITANKTVREQLEALDDDQFGMVENVAKLEKAEKAVRDSICALLKAEIAKIGNTTAALSETQIEQINAITAMLTKYEVTDTEKASISNVSDYNSAKSKLDDQLKSEAEAEAAPVGTAIDNLPATTMDIDKSQFDMVISLYDQYQKLSDKAKAELSEAQVTKLTNAYNHVVVYVLDKAEITVADAVYTGSSVEPAVTVKDANGNIVPASAYETFYNNNTNAGTANVTVVATVDGNYVGSKVATFEIAKADVSTLSVENIATQTYKGSPLTPKPVVKDGDKVLKEGTDYSLKYEANTNAGTAKVTVTGNGNYTGTASKTFTIAKANIQKANVTGVANCYYTGKARTQTDLKVTMAGKVLSKSDYKVTYKNNKNVGKATLTITGQGNYTGTITKTFIVKPRKVANVKVTKGKKRVTVRYKKQNGARYQIYYKTTGSKAKTVKTASVKRTIKKLKSGKTYTIKVRAYKKIGSKTYYGKYSKAKKVRVR
ncbi:hypothetical protein [Zhenpiania hominis]|uniref:hypothetical protein n=1 Tax=Zhenpiania hominis TaxID=2763644 RepID=UPI0039F53777